MRRIRTYLGIVFLLLTALGIQAQEVTTFVHTVKKGETVYSISRTYHVTIEDIYQYNPEAISGIKTGSPLYIPQTGLSQEQTKGRYHTIKKGETLYQLSKRYHVTAEEICEMNPGLTIKNFKADMVIRIPDPTIVPTQETQPVILKDEQKGIADSDCMEMHKVKRRETLFSIAREYKVSTNDIRDANPEMKEPGYKLKKGMFICIPFPREEKKQLAVVQEVKPTDENAELHQNKKPAEKRDHITFGVILPFSNRQEQEKMVEFYRGILMAVEEIKKDGISIQVQCYESGRTKTDLQNITRRKELTQCDFIVGPLFPEQITPLSQFCMQHKIRLVVPFSSTSDEVYQNPYFYAVNPPKSFMMSEATELTMELFRNSNFIILDSDEKDETANTFTDTITNRLKQHAIQPQRIHIENDSNMWIAKLSSEKENIIIPNSSSIKLLNQLFPKLKEFTTGHPEFRIKLVGYPEWQTYTNSHLENFYMYDAYAYTTFYRNPLSETSDKFERSYQKTFKNITLQTWPSFGMLGYDIAYYFMKGISTFGPAFDQSHHKLDIHAFQHLFQFKRISNWSGFINHGIEFIHYTPAQDIELIRLK